VELSAVSSNDINSSMFRSYNPDDDPGSNIAIDQKDIVRFQNTQKRKKGIKPKKQPIKDMTMKALKKQFERTVKDISDDTTAFRVPINSDLAMVDWLVTNYND
jgi:hypothetical protein